MSLTKKYGLTFGIFDSLDNKQLMLLKEAKKQCDYLIVGLQILPHVAIYSKSYAQEIEKRYKQLDECELVDQIIPYATENDIENILHYFKISVHFISNEYLNKDFFGKFYCKKNGIELYFPFLGLENTIFVATPTANLILQKEQSQDVKYIYNQLVLENAHLLN